jgi:hypothetical protein
MTMIATAAIMRINTFREIAESCSICLHRNKIPAARIPRSGEQIPARAVHFLISSLV